MNEAQPVADGELFMASYLHMPGMLAGFVLMDRDLYNCPAEELLQARVLRTWLGGGCVYEA